MARMPHPVAEVVPSVQADARRVSGWWVVYMRKRSAGTPVHEIEGREYKTGSGRERCAVRDEERGDRGGFRPERHHAVTPRASDDDSPSRRRHRDRPGTLGRRIEPRDHRS